MSSHVFHDVLVHLNWHTKGDHPILRGPTEELTYAFLRAKAAAINGATLHGLGGTDTHVHLAVQIEPFVCIADLLQELKGHSAHEVNKRLSHKALEWQHGYGVVSFGRRNPEWVLDYIARQRAHHAAGRVQPRLEACEPDAEEPGSAARTPATTKEKPG
jgi:putative transposase